MNVIRLCGGLGNQLFQYAFGQAQKKYGIDVAYNRDWYEKKQPNRPYLLDKFKLKIKFSPMLKNPPYIGTKGRKTTIYEKGFNDPLNLINTDCNYVGYWQSPLYFDSVLDQLKKEMGEKIRILKIDVDKNPAIADQFQIRGVPTFMLFKKGEKLWRESGAFPLQTLKGKISKYL
jgi:hypothetical protein